MKKTALIVAITVFATAASASDAYFVRFRSHGRDSAVLWRDDILFFNPGDTIAIVRFLSVSNGTAQPDPPGLPIPPKQVVSLNTAATIEEKWTPLPRPALWVLHLDIPTGIVVESRDEFYMDFQIPELQPAPRGKVSMPIFRELTPSGQPYVDLGTDLSGNDSRLNVAIYNAGSEIANAMIEVRRVCDAELVDSRIISVPPNAIVQTGGLGVGSSANCQLGTSLPWERYTVVTVSQPSLSLVSNLNEALQQPSGLGIFPVVGLTTAKNEHF